MIPKYRPAFKRRSWEILVTLFLALPVLTGCFATIAPIRELPPAELTRDCPIPVGKFRTNGELATTIKEFEASLINCNIDKKALRQWANYE